MTEMLIAAALFVGTHLGLSSTDLRRKLVAVLGPRGFLGAYSLVAIATLGFMIYCYGNAPRHAYLWLPNPDLYLVTKVLMPLAMILLLGGFMTRNPTMVGMDGMLRNAGDSAGNGAGNRDALTHGMTRITRHPFQWSVVIWAMAHLIANGDHVSVVFFGSFAVLSLLGMMLLDRKKASKLGADWKPFADVTSYVPFAAIVAGRNRLVPGELVGPILVGLVGYALVFWGHQWITGVRII